MNRIYSLLIIALLVTSGILAQEPERRVKLGVVGLTHTHVHWIFESEKKNRDFEIVGIVETDLDLAKRYSIQHGFDMGIVYPSMEEMLDKTSPQGVTAFGTIRDHLEVVQTAAPRGLHVMVEKPLAVSLEHARDMYRLATKHEIHLLTNYETTWYPSNYKAKELLDSGELGQLRKAVFHAGHKGPKKLGITKEFLDWLIDPEQNGAGALTDFGCYGANLIVWLTHGEKPVSVTTVAQQFQPENNPKVEDEATIIVTYPSAQAIIQASWNWPISRKDMEVYGVTGQAVTLRRNGIRWQRDEGSAEQNIELDALQYPGNNPFSLFGAVIRGSHKLPPYNPSTLENNMIVMEILEAAIESMKTGQTVRLTEPAG